MKKFLIYLTCIITVVCLGLVTYYFVKIDERIYIDTKEIYCNVGDVVTIDSLGIKIEKATKKTKFDYSTGVEEFVYDEEGNCYVAKAAGNLEIAVKTTNRKYKKLTIAVHVGDGSADSPYYVKNEEYLSKIADLGLDKSYMLLNDIVLSEDFTTIGNDTTGFSGTFDGQGHKISGLKITTSRVYAGLFSKLETGSLVKDLVVADAVIDGTFDNAGVVAGSCNGTLLNVRVNNSTISNSKDSAVIGGLFAVGSGADVVGGAVVDSSIKSANARYVGALVGIFSGEQRSSHIRASYTNNVELDLASSTIAGGLVGKYTVGLKSSAIEQTYANATFTNSVTTNYGAFIGEFVADQDAKNVKLADNDDKIDYENLMLRYMVGNLAVTNKQGFEDVDLIAKDNFYSKPSAEARSKYLDKNTDTYYLAGFAATDDIISMSYDAKYGIDTSNFIYYAVKTSDDKESEKTYWDTSTVWELNTNAMPVLRDDATKAIGPSNDYYRKNIKPADIGEDLPGEEIKPDPSDSGNSGNTNPGDSGNTNPGDSGNSGNTNPGDSGNSGDSGTTPTPVIPKDEDLDGIISGGVWNLTKDYDFSNQPTKLAKYNNSILKNSTINGNGHTITIRLVSPSTNKAGLYAEIINSTINDLTIKVVGVDQFSADYAGAIAGVMTNSSLKNVKVEYINCDFTKIRCNHFGGVVGSSTSYSTMDNVTVDGLVIDSLASLSEVGAITAQNNIGCTISNSTIKNAVINGQSIVGGIVGTNSGSINNVSGHVSVGGVCQDGARLGGFVGKNSGSVNNVYVRIGIVTNTSRTGVIYMAGGIAENNGVFNNSYIAGESYTDGYVRLNASDSVASAAYIGGATAINSGTIASVNINLVSVGSQLSGTNQYVGGVTAQNNGIITSVVMGSNVYGNYVGGLAAIMNNGDARMIYIGKFNFGSSIPTGRNDIEGDKYVAGLVVTFKSGVITDVQATSNIRGSASSSRVSLIVLAFPEGATLNRMTVSSGLYGNGYFYRDTWCDYPTSDPLNVFGSGYDWSGKAHFNLYKENVSHGRMKNVVIDTSQANYSKVQKYTGSSAAFGIAPSYEKDKDPSYVREVNGFHSINDFSGSFSFEAYSAFMAFGSGTITKTVEFDVGSTGSAWVLSSDGTYITLKMLSTAKARG